MPSKGVMRKKLTKRATEGVLLTTTQPSLRPGLYDQLSPMIGGQTKDSAVRPAGRPRLQTRLAHDRLEKRLTKVYREERTLEEEQGVSTLYLALGFLKWFDSDQSEEPSFAPLLLVPVSLDRVQGRDGYVLSVRDDDIVVNVSLREKLREFKITLPEIPEGDDWTPSDYFISVGQAVSPQRRFEVDRSAIGLGFFTVIIPGHGPPVSNRSELKDYRDMLVAIRENVATHKERGRSLAETIAAKPTAAYDAKWGQFLIDPAFFTQLVYEGI
jgi:Protein of unknown function (DUF4011)